LELLSRFIEDSLNMDDSLNGHPDANPDDINCNTFFYVL